MLLHFGSSLTNLFQLCKSFRMSLVRMELSTMKCCLCHASAAMPTMLPLSVAWSLYRHDLKIRWHNLLLHKPGSDTILSKHCYHSLLQYGTTTLSVMRFLHISLFLVALTSTVRASKKVAEIFGSFEEGGKEVFE